MNVGIFPVVSESELGPLRAESVYDTSVHADRAQTPYYGLSEGQQSKHFGHMSVQPHCLHLEIPGELDHEVNGLQTKSERWEKEGEDTVYVDPEDETYAHIEEWVVIEDTDETAAKLTAARDAKLDQLRALRAAKFADSDVMVNDLTITVRVDTGDVKDYVVALRDVTEGFKDHAEDEEHATAIDELVLDEYTWPTAP